MSRWCRPMRRLVQHVKHAGQAAADLAGQADALAFAARQRAGGAAQRQVFQARHCSETQAVRGSSFRIARAISFFCLGQMLGHAFRTSRTASRIDICTTCPTCSPRSSRPVLRRAGGSPSQVPQGGCSDSARTPRGSSSNPSRDSAAPCWGSRPRKRASPDRRGRPRHSGTGISLSPEPYRNTCCTCSGRSFHAFVVELVMLGNRLDGLQEIGRFALAPRRQRPVIDLQRLRPAPQGVRRKTAPPSPSQSGQAPKGALNENSRGSISGMVKPLTGQAKFS